MSDSSETASPQEDAVKTFVTDLRPISEQVGAHVLRALQDEDCVAVVTTIASGFPTDRVVSVPINAEQMHEVGVILNEVAAEPDGPDELPCIGFQCRLPGDDKS